MPEVPPQNSTIGDSSEDSSLERLRARLYAQQAPVTFAPPSLSTRAPVAPIAVGESVPRNWTPPAKPVKKRMSWTVLFLLGAVIVFVIAGGLSFFFLATGANSVSSNNITLLLPVPSAIASGSAVPLVVTVQNHNPAAITNTDVTINFPDGTRSADDVTQPLVRYADVLGTIPAGGSASQTVQAVLFGSANQSLTIPVTVQYQTAGSNATFTKTQNYTFTITSSPLSITAQAVGTIAAGQPFTIALAVRSNATAPLQNIAVDAAFPFGFTPSSSTGTTTGAGPMYSLGTLAPGEEKDLDITGTLSGSNNDQRDFQFTVGTPATDGSQTLGVAYASESTNITISKPFLSTMLTLNNTAADPSTPMVITAGEPVSGQVTWTNTLPSAISNGQVTIAISGNAVNPTSVTASNGFYNSASNSILYSSQTDSALGNVGPGTSGTGTFTFATKTGSALSSLRNPTIKLSVSVSGQPGTSAAQTISNSFTSSIEIATDLELTSRLVHSIGPFTDSGPWPPVPNKATTYTVMLSMTNTVNDVGGATASMILPEYVTFTGQTSPNDGSVTYDPTSRTVSWKAASVPAGTGTATSPLTAAFQISYTPSVTQSATSPVLVGNQTVVGTDRFTNAQVGSVAPALSTEAVTDPAYQPVFGIVGN